MHEYVTKTLLLVSFTPRNKQLLCFVHGQDQETEQKHTTKNFAGFHNHFPLLIMTQLIVLKMFNGMVLYVFMVT